MTGTGTDPGTERCGDCGHLLDTDCGCSCCGGGVPLAHAPHHRHPSYSPEQVLCDGCPVCAERGRHVWDALAIMDAATFARAWRRAATWHQTGLPDMASNEVYVLRTLAEVQAQIQAQLEILHG